MGCIATGAIANAAGTNKALKIVMPRVRSSYSVRSERHFFLSVSFSLWAQRSRFMHPSGDDISTDLEYATCPCVGRTVQSKQHVGTQKDGKKIPHGANYSRTWRGQTWPTAGRSAPECRVNTHKGIINHLNPPFVFEDEMHKAHVLV